MNHVVHKDCYDVWMKSQQKKGKEDLEYLCIFRCTPKDIKVKEIKWSGISSLTS